VRRAAEASAAELPNVHFRSLACLPRTAKDRNAKAVRGGEGGEEEEEEGSCACCPPRRLLLPLLCLSTTWFSNKPWPRSLKLVSSLEEEEEEVECPKYGSKMFAGSCSRKGRGTSVQLKSARACTNRRAGGKNNCKLSKRRRKSRRPGHSCTARPSGSSVAASLTALSSKPTPNPRQRSSKHYSPSTKVTALRRGAHKLKSSGGTRKPKRFKPWCVLRRSLLRQRCSEPMVV